MLFDEGDEIGWRVTGERRFHEMRVGRQKIVSARMQVGEIAAASAGDQDLFANAVGMFQHPDPAATLAGLDGAYEAGGSRSENNCVVILIHPGSPAKPNEQN
jgi:hypothetical protein